MQPSVGAAAFVGVHLFHQSTMHDRAGWDGQGVRGQLQRHLNGMQGAMEARRKNERNQSGPSWVVMRRVSWKEGVEQAAANGHYKDSQLPATLGPFNGGRKRHGDVYTLLRSNYASQVHIKHSLWSPTGIRWLHHQKAQERANLHFDAQLLLPPVRLEQYYFPEWRYLGKNPPSFCS